MPDVKIIPAASSLQFLSASNDVILRYDVGTNTLILSQSAISSASILSIYDGTVKLFDISHNISHYISQSHDFTYDVSYYIQDKNDDITSEIMNNISLHNETSVQDYKSNTLYIVGYFFLAIFVSFVIIFTILNIIEPFLDI